MFETPRIVPHEVVNDDSLATGDTSYELDLCEYGEAYEPNSTVKVSQAPLLRPSGHDSYHEGGEIDEHGEQPYYAKDASSGKQGAGK